MNMYKRLEMVNKKLQNMTEEEANEFASSFQNFLEERHKEYINNTLYYLNHLREEKMASEEAIQQAERLVPKMSAIPHITTTPNGRVEFHYGGGCLSLVVTLDGTRELQCTWTALEDEKVFRYEVTNEFEIHKKYDEFVDYCKERNRLMDYINNILEITLSGMTNKELKEFLDDLYTYGKPD